MSSTDQKNRGKIVEIKGVVIDAVFPNELPAIYSALRITVDNRELIAEVQQHLGDDRVRAVAMDSTDGLARGLDVENTGQPLPPELVLTLTEPFQRGAERIRTDDHAGVGLGLAIVRSIVRLHGGEMAILDEKGHGTEVRLDFFDLKKS